ncbi:MAPEG family protein [Thalassovita taeanensis]|uniref:MAPEG family protein n=1 Tax=Thalassovita taeanensis TaxID=657014 RepID=A0A1H9DAY1_9RHOB|nr:MAPEG family protein [Thalassovita taeanensis]SEQ10654.1 MAPEG family protein [Thalassovita taeanensis]
MTPELTALALAGLLHIVQFVAASTLANIDVGPGYTTSPRDRLPSRDMRKITARMLRAYDNHVQMLGLFVGGVALITLSDQSTTVTQTAAWTYLAARALYIPAYAFGWQPWRSYIWLVALACCATLYLAALL